MKLVSPCDRAKTCRKRLLKVPCDCFYDRAQLYSCNLFHATFPFQPIRFSIISVQWGKPTFIFSEYMVTIFITIYILESICYNTCVKCDRYINKYYNRLQNIEVDRIVWVWEGILFIVSFCERYREKEYRETVIICYCWSKLSKIHILAMLILQRQCRLPRLCYVYTRGMNYYNIHVPRRA